MVDVPTVRILADPTKHARVLHTLLGILLPEKLLMEQYKRNKFLKMHETTKEWEKIARIVGPLNRYKIYHGLLAEELPQLAGKNIIFTTGHSVDITDPASGFLPRRTGVDFASESSRLSTEIINVARYLHERYGWNDFDNFHFVYVSPLVLPFKVTPDFKAVHSLEDVVERTERELESREIHSGFGSTTKDPLHEDFKESVFMFRETLFDAGRANAVYSKPLAKSIEDYKKNPELLSPSKKQLIYRLLDSDEKIRKATMDDIREIFSDACYFNRLLMANAYITIAQKTAITKLRLYATHTSYSHDIFEMAVRVANKNNIALELDDFGKQGGPMKNAKNSVLGECDPSALAKLSGKIYAISEEQQEQRQKKIPGRRKTPRFRSYLMQTARGLDASKKPELCPELSLWRCSRKQECDCVRERSKGKARLEKCAVDFANNNFTREDVAKMLAASDGHVDLKALDETYESLLFKKVRVEGIEQPVSELELLKEDCRKQGNSFGSVELDAKILSAGKNERIYEVAKRKIHKGRAWIVFRGDRKLEPLAIPILQPREYSLRASEFSNKCHIARIIANMDEQKLSQEMEILPNKYAVVGTTQHKLSNQRPWQDYLRESGWNKLPVWDYCEREIFCEIENPDRRKGDPRKFVVSGHGDAFFTLAGSSSDCRSAFILDFKRGKRGAYEKPAYILQGMLYAKGAEAATGCRFDSSVISLRKRFFHGTEGKKTFPKYFVGFASPESYEFITLTEVDFGRQNFSKISGVEAIAASDYRTKKLLLYEPRAFQKYAELAASLKLCYNERMPADFRRCFNANRCSNLLSMAEKGADITRFLLDGFVIKG